MCLELLLLEAFSVLDFLLRLEDDLLSVGDRRCLGLGGRIMGGVL